MPTRRGSRRFLATLLFTDIVGSTDTAARVGDREWRRLVEEHNAVVRRELRTHRGREMDTAGDSFFAVFDTPEAAVRCAAAIGRAVTPLQIEVRAGVHTGECELIGGKAGGMAVNIAARIAAMAGPGQVLVSSSTRDMTTGSGLRFTGGSERTLKGVQDAWRVYELASIDAPAALVPRRPRTGNDPTPRRLLIATTVVALAGMGAVPIVQWTSAEAGRTVSTNAIGVLDAKGARTTASVAVGQRPSGVASDAQAVWVTNSTSNTVSRIDRRTHAVTPIPVGVGPTGIAVGAGAVWVANGGDSSVSRIDPATNDVSSTRVAPGPAAVVVAAGAVWVTNTLNASVTRLDPATSAVLGTIPVGAGPTGIASGLGAIWVTNQSDGTVSRIDASTHAVRGAPIRVGNGPTGIAVGAGAVWVANTIDGSLSRIAVDDGTVTTTRIAAGAGTYGVAVRGSTVWVSNEYAGTLSRLDAARASVTGTVHTTGAPLGLAYVGDRLWFTNADGGTVLHRGGILTLAATGLSGSETDEKNLDPFNSYDGPTYRILTLMHDGLVGFRRTAGVQGALPVPDLATALPVPTEGGLTYVFTLRPGLRYSTGEPVRASDIRRGLERTMRSSGAPGFLYAGVRGADKCSPSKPACDLSAGIVTDDAAGTVTLHLTKPDPALLYKLALPPASAVPDGVPFPLPAGQAPPGTGPYMVRTYTPQVTRGVKVLKHGRLVLVRNPHFRQWSAAAQPDGYPDQMVFETGLDAGEAIARVKQGKADAVYPYAHDVELAPLVARHDPGIHRNTQAQTWYFFLNVRIAPFDRVDARRAVAYAIDRGEFAGDASAAGSGDVTCQVLPPDFPGYQPYCPYTLGTDKTRWRAPDLSKAQALVASSGTSGARVVVPYLDAPDWKATTRRFAALLSSLRYQVELKPIPGGDYFNYISDSRHHVQAGMSGWAADYPSASTFLDTLLSCSSFRPASLFNTNYGQFCDPGIDAQIRTALRQQSEDPASAGQTWTAVDRAVTDVAAVVPFSNFVHTDLVGRRVGNYQSNTQLGMLLAQVWVR